ncbi:hypothetical protein X975_00080, partial [Stegodyphus mimosarum]
MLCSFKCMSVFLRLNHLFFSLSISISSSPSGVFSSSISVAVPAAPVTFKN